MAQVSPEAMIELLQTVNKTQSVQIDEQTKTIKELRELVAELRGTIANLEETVHEFKRKLFGSSSEILPSEEDAARECPGKKEAAVTSHKRKYQSRTSRKELYKNIPIEEVKIDIPEEKRFCPDCNAPMKHLGYKYVREEVRIIPAKVVRIHYYKETLYCPSCRQEDDSCSTDQTQPGFAISDSNNPLRKIYDVQSFLPSAGRLEQPGDPFFQSNNGTLVYPMQSGIPAASL